MNCDVASIFLICLAALLAYSTATMFCRDDMLRHICIYTAMSSVFLACFVIFFFAVAMYLCGYKEAASVKWFKFFETGDTDFPGKI
ncbi:unnamed protein product [Soboliphyme baturini]|uniref:MARVEL domain-containing protein n=1 Tax=Soboliphyme baturini TaxID=241478 RepID=A0A183J7N3_9BILA|nr:unnamed protein product [Soboliphyme baturini]